MLIVEYLVFVEEERIKCNDEKSFNNLLQSDPDIQISKSGLTFNALTVNYSVKTGTVKKLDRNYFHLKLETSDDSRIDDFVGLLRAVKSVLHLLNKSPQILFDGVSLFYANRSYPLIFEVESLMRKLITKFMLINVGVNWSKDRVPDDVKSSIIPANKDLTYLHNVDFIQLKHFLFSENYSAHKESLIQKLKSAKDITELDLNDIKTMIPLSNWDKYFSKTVKTEREQLSKKWDSLYELRCRIAHNRTFNKEDFDNVSKLQSEVKALLLKAIDELSSIEISKNESDELAETVAGNFFHLYGEFIHNWNILENLILKLFDEKILQFHPDQEKYRASIGLVLRILLKKHVLTPVTHNKIMWCFERRNRIVHNDGSLNPEEIVDSLGELKKVIEKFDDDTSWL